jgi:tetratricopeptide (TPR) repeat protein
MPRPTSVLRPLVAIACIVAALVWIVVSMRGGGTTTGADVPMPRDLDRLDPIIADAIRGAAAAVREDPDDGQRWFVLGMVYHANAQLELAERCYTRVGDAGNRAGSYGLALVSAKRGDRDGAIAHMTRFAEVNDVAAAGWHVGTWHLDSGRLDEAERWFRRASDIDPDDDGGWLGLARVHLLRSEWEAAIDVIELHLLHGPNDGYGRQLLSAAYRATGRPDDARRAAARGRDATPVLPDQHLAAIMRLRTGFEGELDRANREMSAGRPRAAVEILERLRDLRPDDATVLNSLGRASLLSGQPARAVELLRTAVALRDDADVRVNLALALEADRGAAGADLDGALEQATAAVALEPTSAVAHETLGFVRLARGEEALAVEAYVEATRLDPGNRALLVNLARLRASLGEAEAAAATWARIIELDPSDPSSFVALADIHLDLGALDEAEAALREAETVGSPNAPPVREVRSRLLRRRVHPPDGDFTPQRPELLDVADHLRRSDNRYLGLGTLRQLERRLAGGGLDAGARLRLGAQLTLERLRQADVDGAVREMEQVARLARSTPELSAAIPDLHRLRGLVYLRQAEITNCVQRHNRDCCLLPLRDGGIHDRRGPAGRARLAYEAALAAEPDSLGLRWLLNIAAMAVGEHPDGVAPAYRVPPEAFASEADVGRFVDVAPDLGVNAFNLCGGCIVDDFDGDGRLDIVTTTFDPQGPAVFYRNVSAPGGGLAFEDASASSRLDDQLGGLNCVGADYDDDGDLDVLILRGAWLFDDGRIRNSLVRNNGDGTFTDVTRAAGLADPARPTQAAAWGDYDNDGDLDVFIGNESRAEWETTGGDYPSQLFRNDGDGTFTDVAAAVGVTNDRYCKGVAAGDYDNDGDLDLYVSNIGPNRLYRNNGDGTFDDVATALGVTRPDDRSFAAWFMDYDNDGWLDLFVAAFDASVDDVAADHLGVPHGATAPCLYRNAGDGTFTDVTAEAGLDHAWLPMGANFGDLDNDGWLDVYLATGEPDYQALMPNVMLRNDGGRRFQDVTTSGGFGHLQKGHGVAFADLDEDGDQDVYHQVGGFFPGDQFQNALFINPGQRGHWLTIHLEGTTSNRSALGARLTVTVDTPGGPREIHRAVGSVSSFGGSPRRQEIGLGDATAVRRVAVWWPASGIRQTFEAVEMDGAVRIVEGSDRLERLPRP